MDAIQNRLLALFRGKFGPGVTADNDFASLEIDSLALAELSLLVEQEFHVRLTDRVLECSTIRELAALVKSLQSSHAKA